MTPISDQPPLWEKMRRLASLDLADSADLYDKANALETAAKGFYAEPPTVSVKQFMAAWARARKLYCKITGEPLV